MIALSHRSGVRLISLLVLALGLIAPGAVACSGGGGSNPSHAQIDQFQIVSADTGWALVDGQLQRTDDGGATWRDVTPPQATAEEVSVVRFRDPQHGWVVRWPRGGQASTAPILIEQTTDGGVTWTERTVANAAEIFASRGTTSVHFIDDQHGWLMHRAVSTSNFDRGELFRTSDGGTTWEQLPNPPIADPVHFVDERNGWLEGGATGDQLYVTHDGGETWTAEQINPPPGLTVRLGYPLFESPQDGIIPLTVASDTNAALVLYVTHDGGLTWTPSTSHALGDAYGADTAAPVAMVDGKTAMVATKKGVVETSDAGATWTLHNQSGLPSEATIQQMQFLNSSVGWAITSFGKCSNQQSACLPERHLFATKDGGETWSELTPP